MAPQTTTWVLCQRGGMSRAAAQSMVLRGGLSGAARTAGVPLIGAALTPTFLTTSADQMTSTLTSALATGYVNLRVEEDLYPKKRSGGVGALGLHFRPITGNSARGMAGAQPGGLQEHGKAADLEMNDFPGTLRTRAFGGAEKKGGIETMGPFSLPCWRLYTCAFQSFLFGNGLSSALLFLYLFSTMVLFRPCSFPIDRHHISCHLVL